MREADCIACQRRGLKVEEGRRCSSSSVPVPVPVVDSFRIRFLSSDSTSAGF